MNRPYIKKVHVIIEILSAAIALAALLIALVFAVTADGPVPTHYDIKGNADGWGSAWGGLVFPAIMLLTDIAMSLVVHLIPAESWNTGINRVKRTRRNLIYADAAMMIVLLGLEMSLFSLGFALLSLSGTGKGFLLLTGGLMAAMTATVVWYFIAANRHNRL